MRKLQWSDETQQRWFYGTLGASALSVAWLFWPFFDVIVLAGVATTVVAPMHDRLTARMNGRRTTAAAIIAAGFACVVILPMVFVLLGFTRDGVTLVRKSLEWIGEGGMASTLAGLREAWRLHAPLFVQQILPAHLDLADTFAEPMQKSVTSGLSQVSSWVPAVFEGLALGALDVLLFFFTVVTLLAEGPALKAFLVRMSPLEERYQQRLLDVFRELAHNMVVGSMIVAVLQGCAATLGYMAVGLDRATFLGGATALAALVPLVGTSIVLLPTCIYVAVQFGPVWGIGLAAYGVGVVGLIDNIVRPLMMRGSMEIHPLLIFLAVFGGMTWLGFPGIIMGPLFVAFFLALAHMHLAEAAE